MSETRGDAQYTMGRSKEEEDRLIQQSQLYDAVTRRLLTMADPADALQQLAGRVRPGGIVAFQEVDFSPYRNTCHDDTPLMNQLVDWGLGVFERSGAHLDMGFDLYRAYVEAGPPEPYMHFESPVGGPEGWAGYSFIANSFRSLVPLLEQFGMATADQVDVDTLAERVRQEVVTSKRPLRLPPHVTAWTRLPG